MRKLIATLLLLPIIAIAVLATILALADKQALKDELVHQVARHTPYRITLDDELRLSLFPILGFSLGEGSLALEGQSPFATVDHLSVGVSLWPLLTGKLVPDTLIVEGLDVTLEEDAQGNRNWQPAASTDPASAPTTQQQTAPAANDSSASLSVSLPAIRIQDSRVHWHSAANQQTATLQIPQFNTEPSGTNQFAFNGEILFSNERDLHTRHELAGTLVADLASNHIQIALAPSRQTLAGIADQPVILTLAGNLDYQGNQATVDRFMLGIGETELTIDLKANELDRSPQWQGTLATNTFSLPALLAELGQALPPMQNPDALSAIRLQASLSGTDHSADIRDLNLQVDDSLMTGSLSITDFARQAITAELTMDHMVLDHYLPPETESTTESSSNSAETGTSHPATTSASAPETLVPVELLKPLDVDFRFQAGQLQYDGFQIDNLALKAFARNGKLGLQSLTGNTLGGQFRQAIFMDVTGTQPAINLESNFQGMQLGPLMQWATGHEVFTGTTHITAQVESSGNTTPALIQQAKGTVTLDLEQGTIRGNNLRGAALDGLRSLTSLAELVPELASLQPQALSEDTEILSLHSSHDLAQGLLHSREIRADIDTGQVTATGLLNLLTQDFDYELDILLKDYTQNPYFRNQPFPVRCKGNLEQDAASHWCRPDKKRFEELARNIAKNAARKKALEKLGIEDNNQSMKEAAQEKLRQEAERKLQEKLQEKLKDKLKLF